MKKLLLSFISAFLIFTLSAQVSDNFSDYTVGGKIAQQAQAMGRDYWTTWTNSPGSAEDGVIAEQPAGNKALFLNYNNDQVMKLGKKTSGTWDLAFKIFVPTGKNGYFNVQANFTGGQDGDWACEIYFACTSQAVAPPGTGSIRIGNTTAASFTFQHDVWVDVKINMNLDDDDATLYVGGNLVHNWIYSIGASGTVPGSCPRIIDAFNIYPAVNTATSSFYIDDIVFEQAGSTVIFEANFDDLPNGSYLAQSYPEFWETWDNNPGTSEDALITTEQSASTPHSAKCTYGTDVVFKAGDKTSGVYTLEFDMYFPNNGRGYFNLLHIFDRGNQGQDSEWAIGVYFNVTAITPTGTNIQVGGQVTPFTFPYETWFPIKFYINLDEDIATISINNQLLKEWQFSLTENGGVGTRQLAAADFYPPQAGSTFYIDNFKYTALSTGETFPIMDVTPDNITEALPIGGTATKTITVANTGTSIGEYASWLVYDIDNPPAGSNTYNIAYCGENQSPIGYTSYVGDVEVGAKFSSSQICGKVGSYITKLSYFITENHQIPNNLITFRIYGALKQNEPGELLVEVAKTGLTASAWNEVTLPEPLLIDRTELWVTVSLYHSSGAGPIATDGGQGAPSAPGGNWARFGNSGSFTEFTGWGNINIKATAQGGAYPNCWINISGDTYGTVPKGSSKTFNTALNAAGITPDIYKATLFVVTNDPDNFLFTIPCTLTVGNFPNITVTPLSITETIDLGDTEKITVPVTVKNTGSAEGTYSAEVEGTDVWLKVGGDIEGTVPAAGGEKEFNAIIDGSELEKGEYEASIKVTTNNAQNPIFNIACKLTVKEEGIEAIVGNIITSIYPNPASDLVNIECNKMINSIQVINQSGQIVYNTTVNNDKTTIDTSNLSAGYYFVRVITDESAHSVKLIVK